MIWSKHMFKKQHKMLIYSVTVTLTKEYLVEAFAREFAWCWFSDDVDGNISQIRYERWQGEERWCCCETPAGQGQDGAG